MTVHVQGIGAVGGFGSGAEALARGGGEAGTLVLPWGEATREVRAWRADTAPLERFVPKRALRRVDAFSRMAMLAACLALEDAGLPCRDQEGLGLVLGSAFGATTTTSELLDSMIQDGDVCSSPIHFAGSLHNTPASHVAILLGATGPSLTLSLFEDLAAPALEVARLWLEEGRARRVLVGLVDEASQLLGYLAARKAPDPVVAEGALFLLLGCESEGAYGTLDAFLALPEAPLASVEGLAGAAAFRLAAEAVRRKG